MKVDLSLIRQMMVATLIASAGLANATGILEGSVVGVVDGDTIDVLLVDKKLIRVRLAEIDAPEKGQPWSASSKDALAGIVFGRTVRIDDGGLDGYGKRTVGTVWIDGQSVNRMMVSAGMAWVYRQYVSDRTLYNVEAAAKAQKRGLWVDADAVPPWRWRKDQRVTQANSRATKTPSLLQ